MHDSDTSLTTRKTGPIRLPRAARQQLSPQFLGIHETSHLPRWECPKTPQFPQGSTTFQGQRLDHSCLPNLPVCGPLNSWGLGAGGMNDQMWLRQTFTKACRRGRTCQSLLLKERRGRARSLRGTLELELDFARPSAANIAMILLLVCPGEVVDRAASPTP